MKKRHLLAAAAAAATLAGPVLAHADDSTTLGQGTLLITGRVTDVFSDAKNAITSEGDPTGLHVNVGSSVMPTLGITYFFTDHISAEAILGVTDHHIKAEGADTSFPVYNTWVLPPVVTLQYRPLSKTSPISPYVGAGVNAMVFFAGENKSGLSTHLNDAVGWALQAGFDAPVAHNWTVNADVKKVFVETTAKVDTGEGDLYSHVHLDPWILSVGVGHKF